MPETPKECRTYMCGEQSLCICVSYFQPREEQEGNPAQGNQSYNTGDIHFTSLIDLRMSGN